MDCVGVVELEVDVFNDEGPYFVAETVGIEVALETSLLSLCKRRCALSAHLL